MKRNQPVAILRQTVTRDLHWLLEIWSVSSYFYVWFLLEKHCWRLPKEKAGYKYSSWMSPYLLLLKTIVEKLPFKTIRRIIRSKIKDWNHVNLMQTLSNALKLCNVMLFLVIHGILSKMKNHSYENPMESTCSAFKLCSVMLFLVMLGILMQ
jgi:hypothetical protein